MYVYNLLGHLNTATALLLLQFVSSNFVSQSCKIKNQIQGLVEQ